MARPLPILLLHGDAEIRLLAGAADFLQPVLPQCLIEVASAWALPPALLSPGAPPQPEVIRRAALLPSPDAAALLAEPHKLVVLTLLPLVTQPVLRHRSGWALLAHRALLAGWSEAQAAVARAELVEEPPLAPADAAAALEPLVTRLQDGGAAVAVCNAFRHVPGPLEHRPAGGPPPLRELVRRANLEVARLSQRTGCFVLDVDRPLAQEGGESLAADCFGGDGRAAEIALDELLTLVFDALPDDAMPTEAP